MIEHCGRCGFHIPVDAGECPECWADLAVVPPLAALQVAGYALPTRSVQRLSSIRPRREVDERPVPPAVGARAAFAYSWVLVAVALLGGLLAWVARLDRYVTALPSGTAEWFDDLAVMATLGSVIGLAVGLAAMAVWSIRHLARAATRRRRTDAFG
ncbi:MAG: hypothetical protein ABL966_08925 [Acidimicrobiales bacterium]